MFYPDEKHMDLCCQLCSFAEALLIKQAVQLAILFGKTSMPDIMYKLFNQIFSCLPFFWAPLTSIILYHFQWAWPWLEVTKSVDVHISTDRDEIWCGIEAFKLNMLMLLLSEINWTKEITAVLLTAS